MPEAKGARTEILRVGDLELVSKMSSAQDRLTAYLLGKLSEAEEAELERSYFADEGLLERLTEADRDLMDAYVRSQISAEDRKAFESRLLSSPTRGRKLAFAKAFASAIDKRSTSKERFLPGNASSAHPLAGRPWLVAAGIALGVGLMLLVNVSLSLREARGLQAGSADLEPRLGRLEATADAQRREIERLTAELSQFDAKPRSSVPAEVESSKQGEKIAALTLLPGLVRDPAGQVTIAPPEGKDWVVLELALDELTHGEYRATLIKVGGPETWRRDRLRPVSRKTGDFVLLRVPARLLDVGDYIVRLAGESGKAVEPVADYSFRVVAKPG